MKGKPPGGLTESNNVTYIGGTSRYNSQIRSNGYAATLFAAPKDFFGRDNIQADIVQTLLHSEAKSTLVLGGGGVGKTAVALTVLHDQAIIDRFGESRCFVRCEGLDNMNLFLQRLAEILGITASNEKIHLETQILSTLSSSNCLVCIDNLETLWDSSHQKKIEEMMAKFIHLPTVAVLVTMRGMERPLEPKWAAVHELKPLLHSPSTQVFCSSAGISVDNIDKYGKLLVEAADGVPLALTLLGHLIRRGIDKPIKVWKTWRKRKTPVLNRERTRDPHFSVDTSIEVALGSQRLKTDPSARATLGILSLLPDGIPKDSDLDVINRLCASLPGVRYLENSLSTLTDVALVFVENSRSQRYQILSPIREFVRSRLDSFLPRGQQIRVVQYFLRLINENKDFTEPRCFPVRDELFNIHSVLAFAYESMDDAVTNHDLAHASIGYTYWTVHIGAPVEDIIRLAEKRFRKDARLLSDVRSSHGFLHLCQDRLGDGWKALTQALKLHRQAQDLLGQANDLKNLGELYMKLDRLESAKKALTAALDLHQQAQDSLGHANDLQKLGELYMRLNRLDSAEKALIAALYLHQQAQDSLGQANDLQILGVLYMRLNRLGDAKKALTAALYLHQQVQSSLGQADDLQKLRELYMRLNRLDSAKKALTATLDLHQQARDSLGQADDLQKLGELYMRLNRLDNAKEVFTEALDLHKQVQDSLGQANDLQSLGELYIRLNKLDHAEKALLEAFELHQQAQDSLGQANDLQKLGELYMRLDRLDGAKNVLTDALDLHQQVQDSLGQANDLTNLGELYMRLDRLDNAEKVLVDALGLHRQAQDSLGQANDLNKLGELYMRLDRLDSAKKALTAALDLHKQAQDSLGQANDLQKLGELYMRLNRLDNAEKALKDALDLHQQAQSSLGQANDLQKLGELYISLNRLDSAEKVLTDALDLHQQAWDSLGQANDLNKLGELYMSLHKLDDAEKVFVKALKLHQQAQDSLGQINDLENLEKLYVRLNKLGHAGSALTEALSLRQQAHSSGQILDTFFYANTMDNSTTKIPWNDHGPSIYSHVLKELVSWATDLSNKTVFWLHGDAGMGKTNIAYLFCQILQNLGLLGASFFCSHLWNETSDTRHIVPTIAYDLACHLPDTSSAVFLKSLKEDPHVKDKQIDWQFLKLIIDPTAIILQTDEPSFGMIVVLDALDECKNEDDVATLFSLILMHADHLPIKFFISSHHTPEIKDGLHQMNVTTFRLGAEESVKGYLDSAPLMILPLDGQDGISAFMVSMSRILENMLTRAGGQNPEVIDQLLPPPQPVLPPKQAQSTMSHAKLSLPSPISPSSIPSPQSLPSSPGPQDSCAIEAVPESRCMNGNVTTKVLLAMDAFNHVSKKWKNLVQILRRSGVFEEDFCVMVGFLEDTVNTTESIFLYCRHPMALDDSQSLLEVFSPFPYTIVRVPPHNNDTLASVESHRDNGDTQESADSSASSSRNMGNRRQSRHMGNDEPTLPPQGLPPNGDGSDIHQSSETTPGSETTTNITALGSGGGPPGGGSEVAMPDGWFISEVFCYRVKEERGSLLRGRRSRMPSEKALSQKLTIGMQVVGNKLKHSNVSPSISCLNINFDPEPGHDRPFILGSFVVTMNPGEGKFFTYDFSPTATPSVENGGPKVIQSSEISGRLQVSANPGGELGFTRTHQSEIVRQDIEYWHNVSYSTNPISVKWTYRVNGTRYQQRALFLKRAEPPGDSLLPRTTFRPRSRVGEPAKSISLTIACFYDAGYPPGGKANIYWKNVIHQMDIKLGTSYDADEPVYLDQINLTIPNSSDLGPIKTSFDEGENFPERLSVTASMSGQTTPSSNEQRKESIIK